MEDIDGSWLELWKIWVHFVVLHHLGITPWSFPESFVNIWHYLTEILLIYKDRLVWRRRRREEREGILFCNGLLWNQLYRLSKRRQFKLQFSKITQKILLPKQKVCYMLLTVDKRIYNETLYEYKRFDVYFSLKTWNPWNMSKSR